MAPKTPVVDLNTMLQADRERRKNQALADKILGKGRRSSAPGSGIGAGVNKSKFPSGASLASRIGVAKRNVSTSARPSPKPNPTAKAAAGNVDAEWTHDLHSLNNPTATTTAPRTSKFRTNQRSERLGNALDRSASSPALNSQFNVVSGPKSRAGLSIKGLAGPYVVMAKNFAFGTTAADIESAMTPVGGVSLSCRLIQERPTVIAEIIFESKEGADNVVDTFNNQQADGNLLHVYHKIGGGVTPSARPTPSIPLGPRADIITSDNNRRGNDRYEPRDRNRDGRRDYNRNDRDDRDARDARDDRDGRDDREDREDVIDGSYGFGDRMDTDDNYDRPLYSDNIVGSGSKGGRGRGNDRGRGYR